jgi:hypothetical protein
MGSGSWICLEFLSVVSKNAGSQFPGLIEASPSLIEEPKTEDVVDEQKDREG